MLKYAKLINENTKEVAVLLGNNTSWAVSKGFTQLEVEQSYDGNYYLLGYAPEKPIEQLKTQKWQEIKAIRDHEEQAGVEYMQKVLDTDQISVQRLTVAVQTAQAALTVGQEFVIDWTCQDNSVLTMTAQELLGVPVALATHANNLHAKARQLRELIELAETKEELEQILWI